MELLTPAEVATFKGEGYVIKRQLLEPALMARARDEMGQHFDAKLAGADWEPWMGFRSHMPVDDKPWLVDMVPGNATVFGIVEQLLGRGMVAPVGSTVRGVNCNLPLGLLAPHPAAGGGQGVRIDNLHVDAHPFNLGIVAYFDDVDPGGGGFTVAPQSHRRLWQTMELQYDTLQRAASEFTTEGQHHSHAYSQVLQAMQHELGGGVEITGKAGDCIFWHHRIAHGAGANRSRRIRAACLHDFCRTDLQLCRERAPAADMWVDWGDAVRHSAEAAPPLPPPAQLGDDATVEIRFLLSEAGPMPAPEPAWLCWAHRPLGTPRHFRPTDDTSLVYAAVTELLAGEAAVVAVTVGETVILLASLPHPY